ncbi:hypothetical protein ACI48D_17300 [Massilia sp. LXY-6]|uniref:hypothetical protein n=1 Tax=Massilia sp. LXY-6 TaxID=3379823 RepID=UPI003EE0A6E3
MILSRILAVLRGRRREAQLVFAAMAAAIFAAALMLPVQHTASASLVLNLKSNDGLSSIALPGGLVSTHIATQMDILQSERVLLKAVDRLDLKKNPEWQKRWQAAGAQGKKRFDAWASEEIARKLAVRPVPESSVLTVSYTDKDAAFAAAVANAVVQAYMATNLEMRLEPARQYNQYFEERAAALRASLERARAKLLDYQRANNLVITEEKINLETERLQELNAKLTQAQLAASESTAHRARAASTPQNMREALMDPVVASLTDEVSRQEARLAEQSERLGANHPQVRQQQSSIATLKMRRDAAIRKTLGSIEMTDTVNQSQVHSLEADVKAQRARVLDLESRRVEASLIEREIDNTQRAYDAVLEKASQASLQSGDNQSDISVLSSASVPLDRPTLRLLKLAGAALAGALAVSLVFVLAREHFDQRVRTADDIVVRLGQQLLVILPPMSDPAPAVHPLFSLSENRPRTSPQSAPLNEAS